MSQLFHTSRLRFRSWREEDILPFAALNADPDVMEFFPARLTEEETRQRMVAYSKEIADKGFGLWAVDESATNEFIGFIGLHEATSKSEFTPCIEIGWRLAKSYWNKGYATEGATACIQYGFDQVGLKAIRSFTALANKRSERVMQKIGMVKAGEFDHPNIAEGHVLQRHVLYEINR